MTVREMHIEINQSTQKVAANTTRKFLSQEIDWVLNKMFNRFIQLSLKPKLNAQGKPTGAFTIDQLRVDALRNLVVTNKEISSDLTISSRSKNILPSNYMYLLADQSRLLTDCGTSTTASSIVNLKVINMPEATGLGPYFTSFSITANGKTVSIPGDLEHYNKYQATTNKADISFFIGFILYKLRALGVEAYWEHYDTIYKQNCIIIPDGTGIAVLYNGSAVTNISIVSKTVATTTITTEGLYRANRLEESANIPELQQTAFYQSNMQSPISELENNVLWVYNGKNFTVTKAIISYIRKPKPISIILGSDCEIAEEFHQTICDMATEYLLNRMQDKDGTTLSTLDLENRVTL
jgi:hypothetical protein